MNSLISLQHLHVDADTTALIHGIEGLTSLQDLHKFRVKTENGYTITKLRGVRYIEGSLCISDLFRVATTSRGNSC